MQLFKYFIALILFINIKAQDLDKLNIVARIENKYTISLAELQKYFQDNFYDRIYRDNKSEGYDKALDELIIKQMKIIDFFNLGLNNNKELLQGIRRIINEELVIQYFNTQFYEKYVNEESVQKAYRDMGKEVICQQIILKKPVNASKDYIDSLKNKANDIKALIDNGADFSELANDYSIDTNKTGNISSVNWKKSLSNSIDYVIFNLDTGRVRILESLESILIVKVIKINKIDVLPFEEVKEDILKTLEERYIDISLEDFDRIKNNVINEDSIIWNQEALSQILAWSNVSGFYEKNYADTLQQAINRGENFIILNYPGGKVDLKEYLRLLNDILILGKSGSLKEDDIKKFILEAIRTNIIVNKAKELNLENDIFNPGTKNPIIRNEIVTLYNQQIIEAQIPKATDQALKQFYEENKDSLFYQLAKVNIYALISSDSSLINEYRHKLNRGIPFEKLSERWFVKTFIRNREGIIKSYLSKEEPFLGKDAFKLQVSEVAGPIEYIDPEKEKQYAIIKCVNRVEEKQLLYSDVQNTISDEFIKSYRKKITEDVHNQLRKKYTVNIFRDVLKRNLSLIGS